jgi:hypothetical protein
LYGQDNEGSVVEDEVLEYAEDSKWH